MSARDKLKAKTRRRIDFAVELTDSATARRRVEQAEQALLLHQTLHGADSDTYRELEANRDAALDALGEHYVTIEFTAARPADYEALAALHFTGKDDEQVDIGAVLPALAAACATDEDLRDESFWAETLAPETTEWSVGERNRLYTDLVQLNVSRPDVRIPKG